MDNNDSIEKAGALHVTDGVAAIFCKLFSDTITFHLCDLRRRELNARGIFSCEGCIALNKHDGSNKSM